LGEDSAQLQANPSAVSTSGFYGFWQTHRQSILLGMSALANVGLAVMALQAYQQEDTEPKAGALTKH
jgi:hypothetical protein